MNLSVEYQSQRVPALKRSEEKPVYILGVAFLLVLWAVFSAVTAFVIVPGFIPGHLEWSEWLQVLGDSPMFTT